ncbi:MAG: hypothetical protein J6T63_02655 [Bacteroidales bacterium]|nr:hypothetical protein [Bacteroidales bacterium]
MKSGRIKIALLILLSATTMHSCIPQKKWEKATIKFYNNTEKEAFVYASPLSYYNFFRAKYTLEDHRIIFPPDSVKLVTNDNFRYQSLFFDEERFGMESYGFIKHLSGENIYIGVTKFKMKTCACKTSGGYFKGYFIVHGDKYEKIEIDLKHRVVNANLLNKFIKDEGFNFEIPQQVTLDELISLIGKTDI